MKNSNVRESTISRDTLLIIDVESVVKQRVQKSYWDVPCDSCTMIKSLQHMMDISWSHTRKYKLCDV